MRDKKLKQLIINALFAVIIAILAQITIPIGPIPLTGQTFAVGLAATILGARNATISVAVYIVLGAIGIPVFAGMAAGLGIIFGPTGGFIIGFLFNAYITGYIIEKTNFGMAYAIFANILGSFVTLLFGVIWLKISGDLSWSTAFTAGAVPFIIPGILKATLAALAGIGIRKRLVSGKLI
ncbi:BioY family transporter [Listeria newyorkensis]|uniref:Biotin transporter n=1 Tax=Listeria newyorkensis TaxID=1497681 RepID=A0A841YW18_9LIST|nr:MULTISPECIES: biotin transporter BioY [Listeria]KGL39130.1 biotin synthase [Listeriaceae bacterium FSL A5-0209]KGL43883.1 biotin synthase [Listeria newyorkensis]KMT63272.1 BioY family protein [Listeria newyorkensis]MBC1457684.1 biotin transporter BioY [Listeria newyorkensis]PNP94986.1 BioY family transporter [Listeria newyorkensis]